ncbi:MAG: ArdC family protein [Caulobacter sp.]
MHQVHSSKARRGIYQDVTESIVSSISAGAPAFVMPWHHASQQNCQPVNVLTGKPYRGINVLALWTASRAMSFGTGCWATFRQWQNLGASVKRGECGTQIVFHQPKIRRDGNEESPSGADSETRWVARTFRVFNADQVTGWAPPEPTRSDLVASIDDADRFVAATCALIAHGGSVACYRPGTDDVLMPAKEAFTGSSTSTPTEAYYATLLHELTHWSGASHRLNRSFGKQFGDDAYAFEELVAELGAAFLCAQLGIANEPRPDHAAYLAQWLKILGSDTRAIFTAARLAQEAADYLSAFEDPPF